MSLRVKLHENGEVTISGIRWRDAKSILTSASLHHYDNPFKPTPEEGRLAEAIRENNIDCANWHESQHKLINWLLTQLDKEAQKTYVKPPKTKEARLKLVKEQKRERLMIEEIVNEMVLKAQRKREGKGDAIP
jgi:hypothetical protein